MGYHFAILPEGFLVHSPHPMSDARLVFNDKTEGGLRDNMEGVFNQFMSDLSKKYGDRSDTITQICPPSSVAAAKKPAAAKKVPKDA